MIQDPAWSTHQNVDTRLQGVLLWFVRCTSVDTVGGEWHRGKSFELFMNLEKWHCHGDMSVLHHCVATTLKAQSISLTSPHVQRGSGVLSLVPSPHVPPGEKQFWWTKSNFVGLLPKSVKLRTNEMARLVIITKHFPYNFLSLLKYISHTFFEQVWRKMFWTLLGDTIAKVCASHRNLTWFTRPFLLIRGWGLGTRLWCSEWHCYYIYMIRKGITKLPYQ